MYKMPRITAFVAVFSRNLFSPNRRTTSSHGRLNASVSSRGRATFMALDSRKMDLPQLRELKKQTESTHNSLSYLTAT